MDSVRGRRNFDADGLREGHLGAKPSVALPRKLRNNALHWVGAVSCVSCLSSRWPRCAGAVQLSSVGPRIRSDLIPSPSGAEVHTSNGLGCVTPCTLTVKKNEEFIATFEKPGFLPQQIPVTRQVVGAGVAATAGNVILGGLIGIGVDAATGAGYEHTPNPVSALLQPDVPPPPQPPPPHRAPKGPAVASPPERRPSTS